MNPKHAKPEGETAGPRRNGSSGTLGRKTTAPTIIDQALVGTIHAEHEAAESSLRASVQHAIRAGELLLEAKRRYGRHGGWTQWLGANITFSERLAQAYMRLARMPVQKRNAVADLTLRDALSAIKSREQSLAQAAERENRPPPGPAQGTRVPFPEPDPPPEDLGIVDSNAIPEPVADEVLEPEQAFDLVRAWCLATESQRRWFVRNHEFVIRRFLDIEADR